jgi:hypothetical protein
MSQKSKPFFERNITQRAALKRINDCSERLFQACRLVQRGYMIRLFAPRIHVKIFVTTNKNPGLRAQAEIEAS